MMYQRIVIKLSGEALLGSQDNGIDVNMLKHITEMVHITRRLKTEIALVIGGGNLFRGKTLSQTGINRISADHVGMLATVMNALVIADTLKQAGIDTEVMSGFDIGGGVCLPFEHSQAKSKLSNNTVLIFAAGTGNPCFTTDTAAVLRAIEINADGVFKATKVDGIYSDDPMLNNNAQRFDYLTYGEVITKQLNVMDMSAFSLAQEYKIPLFVFNFFDNPNTLSRILGGEQLATQVGDKND